MPRLFADATLARFAVYFSPAFISLPPLFDATYVYAAMIFLRLRFDAFA